MFTLPDNVKVLNLPEQVEKNREDIASISSRVGRVDARTSDLGQQIKLHDDDIEKLKTAVTNVDTGSINTHYISVHGPVDVSGKLTAGNDLEVDGKIILNSADDVVDGNGNRLIVNESLDNFMERYNSEAYQFLFADMTLHDTIEGIGDEFNPINSFPHFNEATSLHGCFDRTKLDKYYNPTIVIPTMKSPCKIDEMFTSSEVKKVSFQGGTLNSCVYAFENSKVESVYTDRAVLQGSCAGMFQNCSNLVAVGSFDVRDVTYFGTIFYGCTSLKEIHMTHIKVSFDISSSTAFETTDLVEIISNLDPVTTAQTLTMGATNLAKLTQDQILVATGKGWTLA